GGRGDATAAVALAGRGRPRRAAVRAGRGGVRAHPHSGPPRLAHRADPPTRVSRGTPRGATATPWGGVQDGTPAGDCAGQSLPREVSMKGRSRAKWLRVAFAVA